MRISASEAFMAADVRRRGRKVKGKQDSAANFCYGEPLPVALDVGTADAFAAGLNG
jgi:hypothetical protein